jgi:glycosyltransferase involved in cell wall biosynthesis
MPAVLHLLPSLHVGGVERGVIDLCAGSLDRSLVASSGGGLAPSLPARCTLLQARTLAWRGPASALLINPVLLTLWSRRHRFQILHAHSRALALSARVARLLCWALGLRPLPRVIVTWHGYYDTSTLFKRTVCRAVLGAADALIFPSEALARHVVGQFGPLVRSDFVVIHRGVAVAPPACGDNFKRAYLGNPHAERRLLPEPVKALRGVRVGAAAKPKPDSQESPATAGAKRTSEQQESTACAGAKSTKKPSPAAGMPKLFSKHQKSLALAGAEPAPEHPTIRLLLPGRLSRCKGHDLLVRAAGLLRARCRDRAEDVSVSVLLMGARPEQISRSALGQFTTPGADTATATATEAGVAAKTLRTDPRADHVLMMGGRPEQMTRSALGRTSVRGADDAATAPGVDAGLCGIGRAMLSRLLCAWRERCTASSFERELRSILKATDRNSARSGLHFEVRAHDDLSAAFDKCDVVLVPSRRPEAFGRVIVEALAARRLVVTFAHGAAPEIAAAVLRVAGKEGILPVLLPPGIFMVGPLLLVPPCNVTLLAAAMDAAWHLPALEREARTDAGARAAEESFGLGVFVQRTQAVYQAVLELR